ncbi:MAG: 50S ribosomal protein L24e [Nanoarchaeota archaeon]|nr:50S ribosomal protein L24e [Nanoarchaeota archaeon]
MPKCTFCGKEIPQNKGIMYVKNDGKVRWFCSSKCEKNALKLKRNPRKVRWVRKVSK